jgi:hypothetical protein
MKKLLTLTAALSLAASTGLALAQEAGNGGGAPSAGAANESPSPGGAGGPVGADAGPNSSGASGTGPSEKMGPSGAAAGRPESRTEPDRADTGTRRDKTGQNAEKSNKSDHRPDRAATKDDGKQNGADKQRADDRNSATDKSSAEGKSTGEEGAGSSSSLTGEKRTQVQKAFSSHRSDAKADIDIDVSVGVAIPRHVHLVAIPDDIVVIVPAWRRYKYIVVKDTICIIDPDTYEIVDVLVLA